ncbi:unnamed protein product, partial [Meganyctiphanes norvegica]
MPVDINNLTDGWLELESDPGLFTLLLEDMGVKGVQVEEVYDLCKSFEGKVYGFIFLFRWIEERRSRRLVVECNDKYVRDENIINSMFFAQQVVPNSCATHSLVSILLNCSALDLGPTLSRLKAHTLSMDPENKGLAIGNTPELANAHNSHAAPQAKRRQERTPGVPSRASNAETFHFVSYVPVNGRLFELDGLKPSPIDHGPWEDGEDWTEKFRRVITERLGIATGGEPYHDIRFNLMAVVPDKITAYRRKLNGLKKNRQTVLEALHTFIHTRYPHYIGKEKPLDAKMPNIQEEEVNNLSLLAVAASQKLVSQGYAVSPDSDTSDDDYDSSLHITQKSDHQDGSFPAMRGVMSAPSDYSTPLTIQTSPAPCATPTTDTASEAGSAFNSPLGSGGSSQSSPLGSSSEYQQQLVVVRMVPSPPPLMPTLTATPTTCTTSTICANTPVTPITPLTTLADAAIAAANVKDESLVSLKGEAGLKYESHKEENLRGLSSFPTNMNLATKFGSDIKAEPLEGKSFHNEFNEEGDHEKKCAGPEDLEIDDPLEALEDGSFAPNDMLRLINVLAREISSCENLLKDELDKRKRYKIDDSRRTHSYDQFIITFLGMLAEQGKLGDLVKMQLQPQRKRTAPSPAPSKSNKSGSKSVKTSQSSPSPNSKKRGRKKKSKSKRKR